MTDTYKILGQVTAATLNATTGLNEATTVYTVPALTQASISSISVVNSSVASRSYYLGIVPSSDSSVAGISLAQIIVPNRSLAANAVEEITGGITLSAGDQIRVYCTSANLIVQVYGVEIA